MATRKACAVATRVNYNGRPGIVAAAVQRIAGAFDESALGPFDGAHRSFMLASLLVAGALHDATKANRALLSTRAQFRSV